MRAYVDADVFIWNLRGQQRAEVVFFTRPLEVEPTLLFLLQFQTAPVDQGIVDEAAGLHRQWNPSHGLDINAAILAPHRRGHRLSQQDALPPDLLVKKAW